MFLSPRVIKLYFLPHTCFTWQLLTDIKDQENTTKQNKSQHEMLSNFLLFLEVFTNTCTGGTVMEGASGMEVTTRLGPAAGSGAAAAFGAAAGLSNCSAGRSGTMRTRHSMEGTNMDYGEGAINMNFLDSYFSQVIWWKTLWLCYLVYIRDLST